MLRRLIKFAAFVAMDSAIAVAASGQSTASSAAAGAILGPSEGDYLAFCDAPELDVTVKFGVRQNSNAMTFGSARLAPGKSNFGTHAADEIIYFISGSGFATVGQKRRAVRPGASMFVPQGIRHGFENTSKHPLEFVWMQSPAGFEERLRSGAVRSLAECKHR